MKRNKNQWQLRPEIAWKRHIHPFTWKESWIEDGGHISNQIKLSKRELVGLIVIAHAIANYTGEKATIGHDLRGHPNDGYVVSCDLKFTLEHKVVIQQDHRSPVDATLDTYGEYSEKDEVNGANKILIIQINRAPDAGDGTLIKSSTLSEVIDESPYESVMTLQVAAIIGDSIHWDLVVQYPKEMKGKSRSTRVHIDKVTGEASVPQNDINWGWQTD